MRIGQLRLSKWTCVRQLKKLLRTFRNELTSGLNFRPTHF